MKYDRLEQLPVWTQAIDLAEGVFRLTDPRPFGWLGDLRSQLRRAALSVSNNIAEGFERGTTSELLSFLYIARASAGEVRSMLHFVERLLDGPADPAHREQASDAPVRGGSPVPGGSIAALRALPNLRSQISDLKSSAESCSRQIRAWANHLQNSDIAGQRRLTEQTRQAYDARRRAEAFDRKLQAIVDAGRQKRRPSS